MESLILLVGVFRGASLLPTFQSGHVSHTDPLTDPPPPLTEGLTVPPTAVGPTQESDIMKDNRQLVKI